jgi:hypothetical protein
MYYGDPGSGKTTSAIHMALLGKVVVIDAEAGLKKRPLQRLGVPTENILPYTVESYNDLDALYWQMKEKLDDDPTFFAGAVFDSMTEIQKKLIESLVDARHAKAERLARASGATNPDDPFDVGRDEYGKMTEMVRRICRRFRDLPCHTAFVCLAKRDVDKEGSGEVFYRPALTPAFASDLAGYVDVVAYTEQQEGDSKDRSRFTAITRPVGKFRGKDRTGSTPEIFPNPTFDRMVEYVRADDPEAHAALDPYVRQRLVRIGELPSEDQKVEKINFETAAIG